MSVNPGFGGQSFIESQVDKIKKIKAMCDAKGVNPWNRWTPEFSTNAAKVSRLAPENYHARLCRVHPPDYAEAIAGIKASKAPK